jgi:hypothetical protein
MNFHTFELPLNVVKLFCDFIQYPVSFSDVATLLLNSAVELLTFSFVVVAGVVDDGVFFVELTGEFLGVCFCNCLIFALRFLNQT